MSFLRTLEADLRERQILPAVVVLAVLAILIPIAAPLLLGKVSAPPPAASVVPPVHQPAGVASPQQELTDLSATPSTQSVVRKGSEPDPFRQAGSLSSSGSTAASSGSSSASGATSTQTTTKSGGSTTGAGSPAPTTGSSSGTGSTAPKPATKPSSGSTGGSGATAQGTLLTGPSSLKPNQAYSVDINTKDANGVHALSDVVRLAPLPAAQSPEVIYLGVLEGGKKAAFLFTNAIAVSSKSSDGLTCLPSDGNCQIVELSPGQGLSLYPTANSALIATFTFELASIGATDYSSAADALNARNAVSTAGQTLLPLSNSTVLSTLRFDDKIGALVHHSASSGGSGSGSTGATGATGATGSTGSTGTGETESRAVAFAVVAPR
jgi:hypothetical protein